MKKFTVFIEQYVLETCEVELQAEDIDSAMAAAMAVAEDGDVIWSSDGDTKDLAVFLVWDDKGNPVWGEE